MKNLRFLLLVGFAAGSLFAADDTSGAKQVSVSASEDSSITAVKEKEQKSPLSKKAETLPSRTNWSKIKDLFM